MRLLGLLVGSAIVLLSIYIPNSFRPASEAADRSAKPAGSAEDHAGFAQLPRFAQFFSTGFCGGLMEIAGTAGVL